VPNAAAPLVRAALPIAATNGIKMKVGHYFESVDGMENLYRYLCSLFFLAQFVFF
jgi:hypothetical protein